MVYIPSARAQTLIAQTLEEGNKWLLKQTNKKKNKKKYFPIASLDSQQDHHEPNKVF